MENDNNVLSISVKVNNALYERNLGDDLEISKFTLDDNCMGQPKQFAWYAILAENAKNDRDRAKERISLIRAELDEKVRQDFSNTPGEKITEGKVSQTIERHPDYQAAVEEHLDACKVYGILSVAQQAFEHRKDMLVTVAANMRKEYNADVNIKESPEARGALDPQKLKDRLESIKKGERA